MFDFIARWIDEPLDDALSKDLGKDYGKVMGIIGTGVLCAAIIILFAIFNVFSASKIEAPQYSVIKNQKVVGKLPVLNSPSFSGEKIKMWSSKLVGDVYNFNFGNINRQIERNKFYFTPAAFEDFKKQIASTKLDEDVISNRLFVTSTPIDDPVIVGRARVNGQDVIRVQVPVVITFIGGDKPVYKKQWLDLFILAVSTTESPEGLQLARIVPKPMQ